MKFSRPEETKPKDRFAQRPALRLVGVPKETECAEELAEIGNVIERNMLLMQLHMRKAA